MDMRIGNLSTSRTMYRTKAAVLSLTIGGLVFAAAAFVANEQPWGYIAPPALSSANFKNPDVYAFTPWFEDGTFKGDLMAYPVNPDGSVAVLAPKWRAATQLASQNPTSGRNIATTDGAGNAIPFDYAQLTPDQQLAVDSDPDVVNYVRGDRSKESLSFRERASVLGDIVHSAPVFLGRPIAGYVFDDYLSYAEANAGREARVFVGANDGMLHAFDADTGLEEFAYVPSMIMDNLVKLTVDPYNHQYFVDGFLTVEDVQYDDAWHSVLVGGLGAGGRGYYGLDVTDPDAISDTDAADKILWEFHAGLAEGINVGFSYSRPSIIRLKQGKQWAAVFGNGYLSAAGRASLFVVDIKTGAVIKELVVNDDAGNGLSSPTVIDSDGDGYADTAYAGDLNGNVWKFDLDSADPDNWKVDLGGWPFFTALAGQSITTAPEVGRHSSGEGVMVYVGTGRLFGATDGLDTTLQAAYGLWDTGTSVGINSLRQQWIRYVPHSSGEATRTATHYPVNWESHKGWMTNLSIEGSNILDRGERVIQDILLRDGRVSLMSVNPTVGTGDNWLVQLNAMTGGAPRKTIIDINGDGELDVLDNVDGNDDGVTEDIAEDRVVAQYQDFGLASRPVVGALGRSTDAALINHLRAISPLNVTNPPIDPNDAGGLVGGHFDLDTSSAIYDFSAGVTDGHVHQWDDKHDLTTVDYLNLPDGSGGPLFELNDPNMNIGDNDVFLITLTNSELSPGGILEINSSSLPATDYEDIMRRFLTGKLKAWESFPLYTLGEPTSAQAAAGVQQLTSLKMSFDAFAIVNGKLIPSETACVKANDVGKKGEYRNGALMVQALDASDLSGGFILDQGIEQFVGGSSSLHSRLGYATEGLFWESTLFWHWDAGTCYGSDTWQQTYNDCFLGDQSCVTTNDETKDKAKKTKKGKKKKKSKDDDPPVEEDPPVDSCSVDCPTDTNDPGHNVSNTTVGGSNDMGRLFWKELIPEE